jgi:hypothetical protein
MMLDPFVPLTQVRQSHSPVGLPAAAIMVELLSSIYVMRQVPSKLLLEMKF